MVVKKTLKMENKSKAGRPRKALSINSLPSEDEIRKKAEEIYQKRISKGISGTPEEDWLKAEALLLKSKNKKV